MFVNSIVIKNWDRNKLSRIEVWVSQDFNDSNIGHDEFVLTNNVFKEHGDVKEEIKI